MPLLNNACSEIKTCLHSGSFNFDTCTCDCFQVYTGSRLN